MILIHLSEPRRTIALDGSSRAPNRATAEMFVKKVRSLRGHAATTVPAVNRGIGWNPVRPRPAVVAWNNTD
jgi:gamma-glutamyltranspeptidase